MLPRRLFLRRANSHDSSASAGALLKGSPGLSPTLPSSLPRHGSKQSRRKIFHWLAWLIACLVLFWIASRIVSTDQSLEKISYASPDGTAYQFVGDHLPEEPSPVKVTDQRGRSKWTISIPPMLEFPLKPEQYAGLCKDAKEWSHHLAMGKMPDSEKDRPHAAHHGYYYDDPYFMDVADAESHQTLPGVSWSELRPKHCERSLTYVLEASSAGFGKTLLSLWLAYGLAQQEHRAFFIDDTRWPYGSYSSYFKPPPPSGCLPPPKTQIVPCPHQARHLLVSAATTRHTFGHQFANEFEDPKKMRVMRQHKIFGMMRAGYEALFLGKLNDEDQTYLDRRIAELNTTVRRGGVGEEMGVQVRRGDCHPLEHQYHKSYIPLEKYLDTAHKLRSKPNSRILIASDDPETYDNSKSYTYANSTDPPFGSAHPSIQKAQSAIPLSSASLDEKWTGGFTGPLFWSLGRQQAGEARGTDEVEQSELPPQPDPTHQKHPSPYTLHLRSQLARSYILDLAVLGQADQVVCAVSAYACRILAVMMGWERGIVDGGWTNVDGSFDWRGIEW